MSEMKQDWHVLLKFGQRQHIESFRHDGLLYMNSSDYFSILEDDRVRADRFEGTDRIHQPRDFAHIRIEAADSSVFLLKPEDLAGPVLLNFGRPRCNIFCMFSVGDPRNGLQVEERIRRFVHYHSEHSGVR